MTAEATADNDRAISLSRIAALYPTQPAATPYFPEIHVATLASARPSQTS
ncbi:MAG: hypothetical protein KDB27_33645 [Planctomycetales bacterium]|nr:hypothetical protein [Planctomycetales bacterium]